MPAIGLGVCEHDQVFMSRTRYCEQDQVCLCAWSSVSVSRTSCVLQQGQGYLCAGPGVSVSRARCLYAGPTASKAATAAALCSPDSPSWTGCGCALNIKMGVCLFAQV